MEFGRSQLRLYPGSPSHYPGAHVFCGLTNEATWPATLSLPILTRGERSLCPRLGNVFDRRRVNPFESIVSILWKFARMNALPGHTVVSQICHLPVDSYLGMAQADVNIRAVASLLGLTQRRVREGLGTMRSDVGTYLRYCSKCVASGYHSTLHQLTRFERCPLHREPGESVCRNGRRTSSPLWPWAQHWRGLQPCEKQMW